MGRRKPKKLDDAAAPAPWIRLREESSGTKVSSAGVIMQAYYMRIISTDEGDDIQAAFLRMASAVTAIHEGLHEED